MKIELDVKRVEVILRGGTDLVSFTIEKPYPFTFYADDAEGSRLRLYFETVKDHGVRYCQEHFGVFPNIINTRH